MNRNENQSILHFIQGTNDQAVANGIQSSVSSLTLISRTLSPKKNDRLCFKKLINLNLSSI